MSAIKTSSASNSLVGGHGLKFILENYTVLVRIETNIVHGNALLSVLCDHNTVDEM